MASSGVFPFENPILNDLVEALVDIKTKTLVGGGGGNATSSDLMPLSLPTAEIPRRKRSRQITMKGILEAYEKENEEDDPMWVPSSKIKKGKPTTTRVSDKGSSKKMNPVKDSIELPKYLMEVIAPTKFKLVKFQLTETERNGDNCLKTFDDQKYDRKGKRKVEDIELVEESTCKRAKSILPPDLVNSCFSQLEALQTST
ncbi:uncharacterized protein A4U43_C10F7670 [Asparagus officinalis]|uniref:Uncharacterized protein n=1 Tax=Asparagus officinalis TaxID=4686 RepID=A0A5P1E4J8_ASPOF|nr:uncharacterized protein LOC109825356 [Asparagus officinalis]ONK56365.1 uncharacterized protein A4U43_C10F7670 [Asparagus officinalis]